MALLETMIEELFRKQFKYREGRYTIESPFAPPERMQWMGSAHCAVLFREMYEKFGTGYYALNYCASKEYGHVFCSTIGQFVSGERMVAPLLAISVKRFGWGRISPVVTDYSKGEYKFDFHDSPIARSVFRIYGKQPVPVDCMIAGLLAGAAESMTKKKLVAIEGSCLAEGERSCSFTLTGLDKAESLVKKMKGERRRALESVLEAERGRDFLKESEALKRRRNKDAELSESAYLRGLKI